MTTDFTIEYERFDRHDPRLGRHVLHDSRSLNYQVEAVRRVEDLESIIHVQHIPTQNQGDIGSCTGNAAVNNLAMGDFYTDEIRALFNGVTEAERYALDLYSEATGIDPFAGTYPPQDTGSNGLSVAKVLHKRGLISGYLHATSLEAVLTALAKQPINIGTVWTSEMFRPHRDGQILTGGSVAGGHQYALVGLDIEQRRVWLENSWGDPWGRSGRAYLKWERLEWLLSQRGDCVVYVPKSDPAPEPQPVPENGTDTDPEKAFRKASDEWNEALIKYVASKKS